MPRPFKKFKSLDEEVDEKIIPIDEKDAEDVAEKDIESDIISDDDANVEKDDFTVFGDDDTAQMELTVARINAPPIKNWADGIKTKFNVGDLVLLGSSSTVYKIMGPTKDNKTYAVKMSGSDTTISCVAEKDIKFAPKGAVWRNYWDVVNDPYRDWKKRQEDNNVKDIQKEEKKPKSNRKKRKDKK